MTGSTEEPTLGASAATGIATEGAIIAGAEADTLPGAANADCRLRCNW